MSRPIPAPFQPLAFVFFALVLAALAACGGKPPKPPPDTVLNVQLSAEHGASKSASGQSLSISVTLYELAAAGKFQQGDFFGLYEDAQQLLGADLVASESVTLEPGLGRRVTRTVNPSRVRYLGVLAAYRNIDGIGWRDVVPVQAERTNNIVVDVRADGVLAHTRPGS